MALQRKWLAAMGIEADKIDEIIEAHLETVNGLKAERDDLKSKAEKAEKLESELNVANAKLADADKDGFKAKYEKLQGEFDKYKADIDAKETANAKTKAYRELLIKAGINEKRLDTVMKVTDLSKVELVDGALKDADKLTESVKQEWSDFIVERRKEGSELDNPPGDNGDGNDYDKMTMAEYAAARKKK